MTKEWKTPSRKRITEADIDRALAADTAMVRSELRARRVSYDAERDTVFLWVEPDAAIGVARSRVPSLAGLPATDMASLRLWPDGTVLELIERDVHISVPSLLARIVEELTPPALLRSMLARTGGSAISEAKRRSSAENGKRGGRPRKAPAAA